MSKIGGGKYGEALGECLEMRARGFFWAIECVGDVVRHLAGEIVEGCNVMTQLLYVLEVRREQTTLEIRLRIQYIENCH